LTRGGGSVGVGGFFVLSGFLITGVLMKPTALTRAGLKRFYIRRVLRLVPALVAVVLFCLVYGLIVLNGRERVFLFKEIATSLTYTTDFYLGRGTSTSDFGYLGHTWSLSVEEQFYLAWPFLLIVLLRSSVAPLRRAALTLAVAVGFAVWRGYLASQHL